MSDVLVLCYHAVSPRWQADLSVPPDALERQLTYLAKAGWRSTTFTQAVLDPPAKRTLAITFDDAFASVSQFAFPILSGLGLIGTVFVPTDYVSRGARLAWEGVEHWQRTPHADELQPMSWDELGSLADRGWEIGSHTRTHPHLTGLDDDALVTELDGARQECLDRLGRPCESIAYPYGDVDPRVAGAAAAAGYETGAMLSRRLEALGPLRWPRVGIFNGDPTWRFRLKVFRPARRLRVHLGERQPTGEPVPVSPADQQRSG